MNIGHIFFSLSATVSFFTFLKLIFKTLQSKKWINTKATIINSELKLENYTNETDAGYRLKVLYEYTFKKTKYTGSEIDFGLIKHHIIKENRTPFKKGEDIDIFVNPKNPYESVIDNSIQPSLFLLLLSGIISILIVLYNLSNN